MNLEQYLIANPTATLAATQAYTETTDKKRVGSGQARGYFAQTGIWLALKLIQGDLTHALFSLADATIVTATDASSYFGFDMSKADGIANMAGLDAMVAGNVMTTAQKTSFLDMMITKVTPFSATTQADIDNTLALITLKTNPITLQEVTYPAGSVHIIRGANEKIYVNVSVLAQDAIAQPDNLIATVFHKAAGDTIYTEVAQARGNFPIPANWSGSKAYILNHSNLLPHVQIKLTSTYNRVFTANTYTA